MTLTTDPVVLPSIGGSVKDYCSGSTIDHVRAPTCLGCHRFKAVPGRRVPMREVIPQIIDGRVWCSQRVPFEA